MTGASFYKDCLKNVLSLGGTGEQHRSFSIHNSDVASPSWLLVFQDWGFFSERSFIIF